MDTSTLPQNNAHRYFNANGLTNLHILKWTIKGGIKFSPEGLLLAVLLGTFFNDSSGQAALNPSQERLMAYGGRHFPLMAAAKELDEIGLYVPYFDSGSIKHWSIPLNNRAQAMLRRFGNKGQSIQHIRYLSRYAEGSTLARAIMLMAMSKLSLTKRFLGTVVDEVGNTPKLVQMMAFTSPAMKNTSDETLRRLDDVCEFLTEGTQLSSTRIMMDGFMNKLDGVSPDDIRQAVEEINDLSYFRVRESQDGNSFTFVAMPRLHQEVWRLSRYPGGNLLSKYERDVFGLKDSAFCPDGNEDDCLPELGFHHVYALVVKNKQDGTERVYMVGETTQKLSTRLSQHKRQATNYGAHSYIDYINKSEHLTLDIELIATVHHSQVAWFELDTIKEIESTLGYKLANVVRDLEANRRTVKVDTRLAETEHVDSFLIHQAIQHGNYMTNNLDKLLNKWEKSKPVEEASWQEDGSES